MPHEVQEINIDRAHAPRSPQLPQPSTEPPNPGLQRQTGMPVSQRRRPGLVIEPSG